MDGLILIDKERNWTSRDVCNVCQKKFNTKKVGHTGTLDPFATGLLVVTINKANKICQFLDDFPKTYIASLKLGEKTTTLDLTGEIICSKNPSEHTKEEIIEVLNSFLGEIEQIPPMTSAIHYKGRKLYEYAHEGIDVEREARKVNIYDISLLDYQDDTIVFSATVSKGTYIRVLGEDIASKLNISTGFLSRIFKETTNQTLIEFANFAKLYKIKELIQTKGISIKEASYQLGFSDPNYVSRLYKKYFGKNITD